MDFLKRHLSKKKKKKFKNIPGNFAKTPEPLMQAVV